MVSDKLINIYINGYKQSKFGIEINFPDNKKCLKPGHKMFFCV